MKRLLLAAFVAGSFAALSVLPASAMPLAPLGSSATLSGTDGSVTQVRHGGGRGWHMGRGGRGHHYGWARGRHRGHR